MQQVNSSAAVWNRFIEAFRENISAADLQALGKLKSPSQRKYFFKSDLFPLIAKDMGLLYSDNKEFLRVDYTFFKVGSLHKWTVPLICIESENSWESSYEEALKLCSINAPLKVLIQYDPSHEIQEEVDSNEANWDYIFKDFVHETYLVGYFALLVYISQDQEAVTFKITLYNEEGTTIENGNIAIKLNSSR